MATPPPPPPPMDALQLQMDEFACVESMFLDERELSFDAALRDQHENHLAAPHTAPPPAERFAYTIHFLHQQSAGGDVPELEIAYPRAYPLGARVDFVVRCTWLPRARMERLQAELSRIAEAADGELVVLQLYQAMADLLQAHRDAQQADADAAAKKASTKVSDKTERCLGRRAIYFHHIIASTKRRVVQEFALELGLGGFSKIGWPGVVVVEGDERDVQEYVRRLQHLRWKQMVVRGEQTERLDGDADSVDARRRLPRAFCEFPETAMSEAAALCRGAGLEELFLSVMKIYRAESAAENEDPSNDKQVKGRKKTPAGL